MSSQGDVFAAQHHALDSYFEALLGVEANTPAADRTGGAEPRAASAEDRRTEGVPAWASPDFEAVLFRIRGLKLAIPTWKVFGVEPYPDVVTPVDGADPRWIGRFTAGGRGVTLIDLSRIVIPGRYGARDTGPGDRMILFGDGEWAFACDQDVEIVTLEGHRVQWATRRTSRRWLAGTAMAHGCGLLDVEGLITQLEEGEDPRLA